MSTSRERTRVKKIEFTDRVVVVTGAGRALGRAYALEFARRGASVVVNDRGVHVDGSGADSGLAHAVVEEITSAGGTAVASTESVTEPEGGETIIATALERFGRIDALVNNAGILRDRSFGKLTDAEIAGVLDVHLRGAFNVTVPAYRAMRKRGFGRIVMTTSAAGLFGNFGQANYAAAKMALVGLASTIAIEGEPHDIRCNTVAPMARTRMTAAIMGAAGAAVDPEHVVPLVTYLCSADSRVTHQIFSAGGGRFARVFVGVGPGWYGGADHVAAEDVAVNLETIQRTVPFVEPGSAVDEANLLAPYLEGQVSHG